MARRHNHDWLPEMEDSIRKVAAENGLVEKTVEMNITDSEESRRFEVSVYPVPASEKVLIDNMNGTHGISIVIHSIEGKQIETFELNSTETEINIKNYNKGMYVINFYRNGLILTQSKFVKL